MVFECLIFSLAGELTRFAAAFLFKQLSVLETIAGDIRNTCRSPLRGLDFQLFGLYWVGFPRRFCDRGLEKDECAVLISDHPHQGLLDLQAVELWLQDERNDFTRFRRCGLVECCCSIAAV
jgi:hypothetical protein